MNETLRTLVAVAQKAADVIRDVYESQFVVEYKAPRDPVTAADKKANALICHEIAQAFPGIPIVAEESDPETFAGYRDADRFFFVDPLDGTQEFIEKNGQFVVMIGLVEADRSVAGVVHAPATRRVWAGAVGEGSVAFDEGGVPHAIVVSETRDIAQARVVASRSHRSPALEKVLDRLGAKQLVALGSAGLKGAEIAAGRAEIYVGPGRAGKRWDVCAIDAIVTAAGGRLTDAWGRPFDYRSESLENVDGLLATNGRLHDEVLGAVAEAAGS